MGATLSNLLADFSLPSDGTIGGIGILMPVKQVFEPEPERVPSAAERQAEAIRNAQMRAREEEKEAARKRLEEALAVEKARYQEDLESQRKLWVEQEATALAARISDAFVHIEGLLCEKVANILVPVIPEALLLKTLAEFKDIIDAMLSGQVSGVVRITGREDLLLAIKASLGGRESAVEFVPNDNVEVTASLHDTIVQTQLSGWSERIRDALKVGNNVVLG